MPKTLQFILRGEGEPEAQSGEERVVAALSDILQGRHLDYDRTLHALRDMLNGKVRPELTAALLIGQRMNIEDGEEVRAYLDAVLPAEAALGVDVDSLTHFGQPFDGARRYFRPTLFVAAVRAALGRPTVLHGVDSMPPKNGVTEEQILDALGAHTGLSPAQGASVLEETGLVYISQRAYAPGAYALRDMRVHIKAAPLGDDRKSAANLSLWRAQLCGDRFLSQRLRAQVARYAARERLRCGTGNQGRGGHDALWPALG